MRPTKGADPISKQQNNDAGPRPHYDPLTAEISASLYFGEIGLRARRKYATTRTSDVAAQASRGGKRGLMAGQHHDALAINSTTHRMVLEFS